MQVRSTSSPPGPDQVRPAARSRHRQRSATVCVGPADHLVQTLVADRDRAGIAPGSFSGACADIEDPGSRRQLQCRTSSTFSRLGDQGWLREQHPDPGGAAPRPRPAAATAAPAGPCPGSRRSCCRAAAPPTGSRVRPGPPSRATASPRSTPIITAVTFLPSILASAGECGQTYLERSRPLLSHDPPDGGRARTHPAREPHRIVGRHSRATSPTTFDPHPGPGCGLWSSQQVGTYARPG